MTNAETPLTPLEELLVAAANAPDDAAASARFTVAVLGAWVGVPGLTGDQPDEFTPLTITDRDDRRFAVAFTQSARYDTFAEAMEFTEDQFQVHGVEGRALFGMLVRNNLPLLLNPHNDYGKEFAVAEMSDLLAGVGQGVTRRIIEQDTTLGVGTPSAVPEGLVERLSAYLTGLGGVETATLAWVTYPDGLQGYLLGIRSTRTREEILPGIGAAVGDLQGRALDVTYAGPGEELPTDSVEPFLSVGSGA
jgi:SseB protein N-terminal domain